MTPSTTQDVVDLLDASFASAALGAALELGLFWMLADTPQTPAAIAARLGIPPRRCGYWLQVLTESGLLEQRSGGVAPSASARNAILGAFSRETWAFLALEARERFPVAADLAHTIRGRGAPPETLSRPDYVKLMTADADRARRFTRMLYELHLPLAEQLAAQIDVRGAARLLDLGGGSGVVSLALARRHANLSAVVVDLPTVCDAARSIAEEDGLLGRVTYHPADFVRDPLPRPFDLVVMCDVGVHGVALFSRVAGALGSAGRFILVDVFAPAPGMAAPGRAHWALERSLADPSYQVPTVDDIEGMLNAAGFEVRARRAGAPIATPANVVEGMTIVEAVPRGGGA